MKNIIALLMLFALTSAQAGEAEIRQSLQSKFPNIGKLEHIVKTPYSGLYEIVVGEQLLYTDERGQYLFDGSIIETKSRTNLTEQRSKQLFAINFDTLPLNLAVKKVKGNGKRKMAYFTDPNCGFCRKLEQELSKVNNVTLYLFMYPIFQGSDEIVRNVHCAKDPIKAWDELMLKGIKPASRQLQNVHRPGHGAGQEAARQRHAQPDFRRWHAESRLYACRRAGKNAEFCR